jgi:hypothetical protein
VNDIEEELRTVLGERAAYAPHAGALLGAVHARSRQHATRRRAALVGGSALAVTFAVAAPALLFSRGDGSPPTVVGSSAPAAVTAVPQVVLPFRVGFIPAGWYRTQSLDLHRTEASSRLESPDPSAYLTVWVFDPAGRDPSGPVPSGEGSVRVSRDADATHRIVVEGPGVDAATARRVRDSVDVRGGQALTFPYRLGYLPRGLTVTFASTSIGHAAAREGGSPIRLDPPATNSGLMFADRPGAAEIDYALDIGVSAIGPGTTSAKVGRPDTVFAGHQARVQSARDGTVTVILYDVFPRHVVVLISPRWGRAELERIVRGMRPVRDIDDLGSWVSDPLPR